MGRAPLTSIHPTTDMPWNAHPQGWRVFFVARFDQPEKPGAPIFMVWKPRYACRLVPICRGILTQSACGTIRGLLHRAWFFVALASVRGKEAARSSAPWSAIPGP